MTGFSEGGHMNIKKLALYALVGIVGVILLHTVYSAYVASKVAGGV